MPIQTAQYKIHAVFPASTAGLVYSSWGSVNEQFNSASQIFTSETSTYVF